MSTTELTDEQIVDAIQRARGVMSAAARDLGMSRQGLYKRLRRNAELLEALEHERESLVDLAEQKLIEALEAGERWAIALTLTRMGASRGWGGEPRDAAPEARARRAADAAQEEDAMASLFGLRVKRRRRA